MLACGSTHACYGRGSLQSGQGGLLMLGYQYGEARSVWTPEREALLIKLLDGGVRPCEIATQLGVTSGMVAGKIGRIRRKREKEQLASQCIARPQETASPKPSVVRLTVQDQEKDARHPLCEPVEPRDTTCKWPTGDPMSPDFHLCGKQVAGRGSYCANHAAISRQPRRA